jgi:hypothetical protein
VAGQALDGQLADLVYDPFVPQEQAEQGGELLAHYQAPLTHENDVFMEVETGSWVPCSPPGSGTPVPCGTAAWNHKVWNEQRLHWEGGALVPQWTFASDWKPEPDAGGFGGWEPVFHAALEAGAVYVPGAGGTVYRLDPGSGALLAHINPFGTTIDANTFVAGPLTVDSRGNLYYNAVKLDPTDPWSLVGGTDSPDAHQHGALPHARPRCADDVCGGVQHRIPALAAQPQRHAGQRAVPVATAGDQRGAGGRPRRHDLHGQSGARQQPVCLPGRGERGPDAEVGRLAARSPQ